MNYTDGRNLYKIVGADDRTAGFGNCGEDTNRRRAIARASDLAISANLDASMVIDPDAGVICRILRTADGTYTRAIRPGFN